MRMCHTHATQANVKHGGAKWLHKLFFYIPCQKVHSVHMNSPSSSQRGWGYQTTWNRW